MTRPPRFSSSSSSKASKMSMDGWWMVHTTVRPVSTVLRTVRITMAAARASRPAVSIAVSRLLCAGVLPMSARQRTKRIPHA